MSRAAEIIKRKIEITELEIKDWKDEIKRVADEGCMERMLVVIPTYLRFIEQNCAKIKMLRELLEEIEAKEEAGKSA
jgi:hypothetical protein